MKNKQTHLSNGSIISLEPDKSNSRCRRWKLQLLVDSKQKQKRVHGTYGQAKEALDRWKEELSRTDELKLGDEITFGEFSNLWLEMKKREDIKPKTLECNQHRINAINFYLSDLRLGDVRASDIENMLFLMKQGKTISKRKYKSSYRYDLFVRTNLIFEKARKKGLIRENPCDDVKPPKPQYKNKIALSKEQLHKLLSQLDYTDPIQSGIALCATTGMRRAEAANLCFSDIYNDLIHISSSKTKSGIRELPVGSETLKIINVRLQTQHSLHGEAFNKDLPICGILKCPDPHSLSKWWDRNRKRLGLEDVSLHELRHTYLTLLAEADVQPAVMQRIAGHSSPVTTLKIYTHVHNEAVKEAITSLDDYLS